MRQKKTKQMLDYWMDLFEQAGNSKNATGPHTWPERSDVQPAQCGSLLGDMFILETVGADVNYRLAGTRLCSLYGRELKREAFREAYTGADQRSVDSWASRLSLDDYVVLICSVGETASNVRLNMETLLMPLSHNGRRGSRTLGITVPCENPAWIGADPIVTQSIRSVRVLQPWDDKRFSQKGLSAQAEPRTTQPRRTPLEAPRLFTGDDRSSNESRPIGAWETPRQVGHLTVFEGGRE